MALLYQCLGTWCVPILFICTYVYNLYLQLQWNNKQSVLYGHRVFWWKVPSSLKLGAYNWLNAHIFLNISALYFAYDLCFFTIFFECIVTLFLRSTWPVCLLRCHHMSNLDFACLPAWCSPFGVTNLHCLSKFVEKFKSVKGRSVF